MPAAMNWREISEDADMTTNLDLTHTVTQVPQLTQKLCGSLLAPTSILSSIMNSFLPPEDATHLSRTNLQRDAVRLCIALQSHLNPAFLGAATELLSCVATLSSAEFRRHSRKIIRLIETARDRLEASGISLYLFTASYQKGKWKDVYFDLLRMLQARRSDVEDALQARTNSLLIRLSSNFVGRESSVASSSSLARISLPEKSRASLALGITTCTPHPSSESLNITTCITMPPPDAFPPSVPQSFRRRKRSRPLLPFWVSAEVPCPRKRARHTDTEQENEIPRADELPAATYVYKAPPLTKRFGIYCTGKSSMHQPHRPWSVRAC
ncbi:hypothetical protein MSAN_00570400 [Mycena sanguinolenta]|uniref:Uncharacterized protein n=1 Tax=Mycena sanguinolenta TaxID=230812 RepID=A0A8H7DGL0_9AGAR|nr:hypothetical protein MSAN_00570400 [Mycena sanguinolenta]